MNTDRVKRAIKSNKVLNSVISFDSIDSTNKYLMSNSFSNGTIAVANEQTAGRGKHGAKWSSGNGGLWFSYVINKKVKRPYTYVILSSAAVVGALSSMDIKAEVKWPNDIIVNEKKVCGMLVENDSYHGKVVTGIGINVNNSAPKGAGINALSLKDVLGRKINLEDFFILVVRKLDKYLADMAGTRKQYVSKWVKSMKDLKGKTIKLLSKGRIREFVVVRVNKNGSIKVIDGNGKTRVINGEVFFI